MNQSITLESGQSLISLKEGLSVCLKMLNIKGKHEPYQAAVISAQCTNNNRHSSFITITGFISAITLTDNQQHPS